MFAALPPEVNSSLMYSGPGLGPMLVAATAWDGLAAELDSTAVSYGSVVSHLISESWFGPASLSMAAALAPFVAWMHTTAAQAAQTATQARAVAAAYEAAFSATVPPSVIAANRALVMSLVATNIIGQNAPAIAATQADYAEMWAQDATAMYGYAGSSASAAALTPFTPPTQDTNPGGLVNQAAAVARATGTSAQTTLSESLSAVPRALQALAAPLAGVAGPGVVDDVVTSSAVSGLSVSSAYHTAIGSANFFQRVGTQFAALTATQSEPTTTDIMAKVDRIGLATGALGPDELREQIEGRHFALGSWQDWLKWLKGLGGSVGHLGHAALTADIGHAATVGGLSVPQTWATAAPGIHLVNVALPAVGVDAAPVVADGGGGHLYAGAALAAMAGRALAGTAAPGGGGQRVRPAARERGKAAPKSSGPPVTGNPAELRDVPELIRAFGQLRDLGLLTDEEFDEQKRYLLSRNLRQPGR